MGAPQASVPKTLLSIQYLRGLAALAVVLYHVIQRAFVNGLTPTDFQTGGAGVDVFFVVSGFVMWAITDQQPASPSIGPLVFLWRRIVRIGPPYWFATLLAAGLAMTWPPLFRDVWLGGLDHLVLSLLFIPHPDPRGLPFPLLQVGWTLNYEALFYLVFAVGLVFARGLRLIWLSVVLALVWLAGELNHALYAFIANPLVMEFLAGVWLAKLWREGRLKGRVWAWLSIGYGLAMLCVLQALDYHSEYWRPLLWGGPAVLIVGGAVALEASGFGRPWPWLQGLGDASYSLYLFHPLAISALAGLTAMDNPWSFIPEGIVLSLAVGLAGRWLIEKPTLRLLRGKVRPGEG
jgi:exopolysaccharide production protein ExoZ